MIYSSTVLADIHLDLLYETDESSLILHSRDPDVVAPLVHLVRTTEGNRWLIAASLSAHDRSLVHDALLLEPVVPDIDAMEIQHLGTSSGDARSHLYPSPLPPAGEGTRWVIAQPPLLRGLRELLGEHQREYRGPAFSFPEALAVPGRPVEMLVEPVDAPTVPEMAWIRSAGAREQPLCVARNEAGEIVAVCHSARSTARAAEAGVETASAYRGRGLASAVVAGWAAAVRSEGRVPVYSTWWGNTASRALARRLGLLPFGEDVSFG